MEGFWEIFLEGNDCEELSGGGQSHN